MTHICIHCGVKVEESEWCPRCKSCRKCCLCRVSERSSSLRFLHQLGRVLVLTGLFSLQCTSVFSFPGENLPARELKSLYADEVEKSKKRQDSIQWYIENVRWVMREIDQEEQVNVFSKIQERGEPYGLSICSLKAHKTNYWVPRFLRP